METTITDPKRNSNESHGGPTPTEEWIVTTAGGLITKVERFNRETKERTELTREEYAGLVALASGYAAYYSGIRDYALALGAGNTAAAQAYYQGMTDYFNSFSQ